VSGPPPAEVFRNALDNHERLMLHAFARFDFGAQAGSRQVSWSDNGSAGKLGSRFGRFDRPLEE
jgi:hypothetical protein